MTIAVSRRQFLQLATAAAAAFGTGGAARASSSRTYFQRLGFQSFTVADALDRDAHATLQRLADIGYKEVELHDLDRAVSLGPLASKCGLEIVGSHIPGLFPSERAWLQWLQSGRPAFPSGYDVEGIVAKARAHGFGYVGYARVPPADAFTTAEKFDLFCAVLDRLGERCRQAGIRFAYHNHFQEFARLGNGTFFDALVERCDPRNVAFEIDVCWAAHAGQDPAALITRLADRVPLIHLKDRNEKAPISTANVWPEGNIFAEVGSGVLDVPAILRAAHASGVEHVFVEQDETTGDPLDSLAKSYAYVAQQRL